MAWTRAGVTRPIAAAIAIAATATVVLATACSTSSNKDANAPQTNQPAAQNPITTSDSDWKPVTDILGRTGKLGDNNTAYRVTLTRNDLQITSYGVAIKPGLSLGGYVAFARYDN